MFSHPTSTDFQQTFISEDGKMKKSIAALAVAGTLCGWAQAQSAVNIYGIVDMGYVNERGGAAGSNSKLTSGAQSGTRLGFKGTEDLGDGMKALFVLETSVKTDEGGFNQNGTAFGRQTFVGLQSDGGTLTLGRQYTPYFLTINAADPFASGTAGSALNLFPYAGNANRMNNSVKYATPNIDGFSGEIAYGFGEVQGSSEKNRQIGGSLGYAANAFSIKLAHHNVRNATDTDTAKNTLLGATWDLEVAKIFAAISDNRGIASSLYPSTLTSTPNLNPYGLPTNPVASSKTRDFLIGLSVPVEKHTFLFSYINKDDRVANNDANQVAIGYTYALSKQTNLYAAYARINNKNQASYTVGNNSEPGSGDKALNLGVRVLF
jgi:predicted porin